MKKKIQESKSYEELQEVVTRIFSELDKGIKDARARINELNTSISQRGTDSLQAIQENTQDKVELEQVTEFYNSQQAKHERLVKEYAQTIFNKASQLKSKKEDEFNKVEVTKAKVEALEHWKAIIELEDDLNKRRTENKRQAKALVEEFEPYYTDKQTDSLMYLGFTFSDISLSEMIIDNDLNLSDLKELNKTDEEKQREAEQEQREKEARERKAEEFRSKHTGHYL